MYLMRNHDVWIYVRCANSDPCIAFDRLYDLIDEAAGHGSIIDCNVIRKRFWNHLWMTCLGYGICKNKNIKNALHLEKIFSILQNRNTILPESIH